MVEKFKTKNKKSPPGGGMFGTQMIYSAYKVLFDNIPFKTRVFERDHMVFGNCVAEANTM